MNGEGQRSLRDLPSVDEVMRQLLVGETRRVLNELRERLKAGERTDIGSIPQRVLREFETLQRPSLRRVINATGVVLHTNLGRAPLPAGGPMEGYSNLEYDLETGKRGKRDVHIASLIERLTGKPGIAVNNNAAAVYLVLNELAAGHEVIVSRGELIEIGDGFRIPDIMTRSGAVLQEIGTTNRTGIEDYRDAISERTRLIFKVHPSNFRMAGFTSKPSLGELADLARERRIPLYEDLGSGCLMDLRPFGIGEPLVSDSIRAGVNVVSFSGDKLAGGPQAGLIAGDGELVARVRRNPMYRALRVDKIVCGMLESTLKKILFCRWDEIPALRMISLSAERIRERAEELVSHAGLQAEIRPGESVIGGGSTPDQSLPTFVIAIRTEDPVRLEQRLRASDPPVIARIESDQVILDLRTVLEEEEESLAAALKALLKQR